MSKDIKGKSLTRKDALNKMGKYLVLTTVGTFLILSPKKSQAQSIPPPSDDNEDPFLD